MNEIEQAIEYWENFRQESVEMIAKGKDRNDILAKQVPMCDIALAALRSELDRIEPITNADRIRNMTDEDLAKISTYCTTKPDYDCFEIEEWHSVFTAGLYDSEEDAINYTIDWLKQAERKHSMIQQEARKNAFIAIVQDPSAVEYRSCWNCNGSHEHLKKHELIKCFECGRLYYKGIDISDDDKEDKP